MDKKARKDLKKMRDVGNTKVMAENIRRYVNQRGISVKDLSDAIGYPYTSVLSWANGKNYPRIDKIEAMADYFGCLKSDLIEKKTPEQVAMQQKNDALSSVVVRMRMDDKFFSAVLAIDKLDPDKLDNLLALLK